MSNFFPVLPETETFNRLSPLTFVIVFEPAFFVPSFFSFFPFSVNKAFQKFGQNVHHRDTKIQIGISSLNSNCFCLNLYLNGFDI